MNVCNNRTRRPTPPSATPPSTSRHHRATQRKPAIRHIFKSSASPMRSPPVVKVHAVPKTSPFSASQPVNTCTYSKSDSPTLLERLAKSSTCTRFSSNSQSSSVDICGVCIEPKPPDKCIHCTCNPKSSNVDLHEKCVDPEPPDKLSKSALACTCISFIEVQLG